MRPLAAFLLLATAWIVGAQPLTAEQKDSVLKSLQEIVTTKVFVPGIDFTKWPEFIAKQKDAIDKATEVTAFGSAVNRALREFGLSHIRFLSPRATAARGQTSAVGAGLSVTKSDGGLTVRGVADNGPAKAAGISSGDVITKVDGKTADDTKVLDGDKGTKVEVEVKKPTGEVKTVTIERKEYSTVRLETLTWPNPETAVLRVFTFANGYGRQNIETLMTEAAKAKYLILDLRSNGGGASSNLNHLLSLLLPDGTAYGTFVSKRVADKYAAEAKGDPKDVFAIAKWSDAKTKTRKRTVEPFKGKIAVLINRGSASASEICAAALKENANAILVGSNSAGAVLASVFGRLPEGFSIQYPVSDYITVMGVRLEKNPLVPDVVVGPDKPDERDPAVVKAMEALTKK